MTHLAHLRELERHVSGDKVSKEGRAALDAIAAERDALAAEVERLRAANIKPVGPPPAITTACLAMDTLRPDSSCIFDPPFLSFSLVASD